MVPYIHITDYRYRDAFFLTIIDSERERGGRGKQMQGTKGRTEERKKGGMDLWKKDWYSKK